MSDFEYAGSELDLFSAVVHWKKYWASHVAPFISGDVVEIGAGLGANTSYLDQGQAKSWLCVEPDRGLLARLEGNLQRGPRRAYRTLCGTLQSIPAGESFDTILYIDVLEHIEHDGAELVAAAKCLRAKGRIIVLSPAHQWLFTPFDKAVGHYRRYNRQMLRRITPSHLAIERMFYLDSVGLFASLANRLFLKQSLPTRGQLAVWDSCIVPASRFVDPILFKSAGKTIIGVWQLPG